MEIICGGKKTSLLQHKQGKTNYSERRSHSIYTKHSTQTPKDKKQKNIIIDRSTWMIVKLTYLQYNIQFKFDEYLSLYTFRIHARFLFSILSGMFQNKIYLLLLLSVLKYNIIVTHANLSNSLSK